MTRGGICSRSRHATLSSARKNLSELLRRNHFKLRIRAVARLLVGAPSAKFRHVPKSAALHMLVSNLHHQFSSHWLPREVFALAPSALTTRHALLPCTEFRPPAPGMIHQRVTAIRLQEVCQLAPLLLSKAGTHTNVLQRARIIE